MNKSQSRRNISADALKIISLVLVAISIIGNGIILRHYKPFDIHFLKEGLTIFDIAMGTPRDVFYIAFSNLMGRVGTTALPILAFLLVEGYLYTDSFKHYLLRMVCFALISLVPNALFLSGKIWTTEAFSPMLMMAFSLVVLKLLNMVHQYLHKMLRGFGYAIVLSFGLVVSVLSRTNRGVDYNVGTYIVIVTALMYLFYNKPLVWEILLVIISVLFGYYIAPFTIILFIFYNGRRTDIINKYIYYAAYPVLLIIGAII